MMASYWGGYYSALVCVLISAVLQFATVEDSALKALAYSFFGVPLAPPLVWLAGWLLRLLPVRVRFEWRRP
jgi:hypothetical protein